MKRKNPIGTRDVCDAAEELARWRRARETFDRRVTEEEKWYRSRVMPDRRRAEGEIAPTSAWLFNSVLQKHADLMECIPTAVCLAREPDDEAEAAALSSILPVILDRTAFEAAYSDNAWFKLKHGVSAWGVFWNNALENGLGDVDVRRVELLNLYWQPGVRHLQDSRAVYYMTEADPAALCAAYPQFRAKVGSGVLPCEGDPAKATVSVVERYYKKRLADGRTVLHYMKFADDVLLFASENDPRYAAGWYEHGQYPFVLDVLYPVEGECTGFGIIALARDPQTYIDRMDKNLLEYMDWATRVRYFSKKNAGLDERAFADLSRRVVEVEGDLEEERLRQITVGKIDPLWLQLKDEKINELKETTANRNVLQGSVDGGVTAAAAIAALQEAGNKAIRDIISVSYRGFVEVVRLVIECVRQFYTERRCFRILGEQGYRYLQYSNEHLREKETGTLADGTPITRRPIFDIDVRAEKQDAYTRLSHNEMMKDLYNMGVFDARNAAAAKILLDGMDFPGVARLRAAVAALSRDTAAQTEIAEKRGKASPAAPVDVESLAAAAVKKAETVQEKAKERTTP